MSDAAAFFASKKKKKKGAKGFNANKINAASVTTTVHVDAPALSTETDAGNSERGMASVQLSSMVGGAGGGGGEASSLSTATEPTTLISGSGPNSLQNNDWDDEALAASLVKKGPAFVSAGSSSGGGGGSGGGSGGTAELLDMKALEVKRREQDDIAERLRVEETRNLLAAAREGMEREAQRLRAEEEKKEQEEAAKKAAAASEQQSTIGGGVGRWVPSRMRAGGAAGSQNLAPVRMGMMANAGGASSKLDVKDENLFPDLAAADEILEEKQKLEQQVAYKLHKKTPVGGGATWASRAGGGGGGMSSSPAEKSAAPSRGNTKVAPEPAKNDEPPPKPRGDPKAAVEAPETGEASTGPPPSAEKAAKLETAATKSETPSTSSTAEAPAAPAPKKRPTARKKKDLSTFKKSS